jgi:hypothetical protein
MNSELSTSPRRRLPDSWVQKIFLTMQGHYGTRFLNMWCTGQILPDGQDAGLVNAMNHWAEKLGGYIDSPATIKRVLANLPPEPPTLPQFCEMLRHSWAPPETSQLTHEISEEQIQANKQKIKKLLASLYKPMAVTEPGEKA